MADIGIHNGYWIGTPYEDMFSSMKAAAAAGADVYEIETWSLYEKSVQKLHDIKKQADELGIRLICNGGFSAYNDIASDDPAIRRKGIDMAFSVLKAMETAGITSWSGINYSSWLRLPETRPFTMDDKERILELSISSLKEIVQAAKDSGVIYCLEIVTRYEQFLINTVEEGIALIERVGSDNLKLLLDLYHMNIEEDSIIESIHYAAQRHCIGELHVGESNRRIPGTGATHLDWPNIFGALKEENYEGPIVMEPFVLTASSLAYDIRVWRDLSKGKSPEELANDVASGIRFIRSFF